jgi:hypothetical protein
MYYEAVRWGGHGAFKKARRQAKAKYEKQCACDISPFQVVSKTKKNKRRRR